MNVRGIDANYYTAIDINTLTEFYSKLLGEEPVVRMDRISEWTFSDGSSFGLYMADGKTGGRSGSVMFAVDEFPAGSELTETPVCQMAFGYDPEGNQYILHKRK